MLHVDTHDEVLYRYFAYASKNECTHKSQVMYEYICTHGRHRLLGKCCGLGKLLTQKREGRKGRGMTIKWTYNRDGKAMQEKEERHIRHKAEEEEGGGGGLEMKI
jgi:hypothetical protein